MKMTLMRVLENIIPLPIGVLQAYQELEKIECAPLC